MKFSAFIVLGLILGAGVTSFAAERTIALCDWTGSTGDTNHVSIHQDTGGQVVALYTTESFGGSTPTFPYKVTPSGSQAAGFTYTGTGFTLQITAQSPVAGKYVSFVSIPSMKVNNRKILCRVNAN